MTDSRDHHGESLTSGERDWGVGGLRYLVTLSLVGTFVLMAFGAYSVAIRGWMSCGEAFPRCAGSLVPMLDPGSVQATGYTVTQVYAEWFHRSVAFVTGLLMLAATIIAWRRVEGYQLTTWTVTVATALLPFEAYLGVVTGVPDPPTLLVGVHLVLSYLVLIALVIATGIVWWSRTRTAGHRRSNPQ